MREIKLTQGQVAIVDDEDYEYLSQWKWCAYLAENNSFYARRTYKKGLRHTTTSMHREIMKPSKGEQVDHINHNTLDNRKENLRNCTRSQNQMNSRLHKDNLNGFKGVRNSKDNKKNPYVAAIIKNKKYIHIGSYASKEEAARAYDKKAIELFGEFACLNFP